MKSSQCSFTFVKSVFDDNCGTMPRSLSYARFSLLFFAVEVEGFRRNNCCDWRLFSVFLGWELDILGLFK